MITLSEHKSESYGPRTFHNAAQGVTLAVAVDFTTGGEKLTEKAAKGKIVKYNPLTDNWLEKAKDLKAMLEEHSCTVVNVAGNGIYSWSLYGLDQNYVNKSVYRILRVTNFNYPLSKIVSGGQSGADIAGLIAAAHLDIPSEGTWPKGFKMRFEDRKDATHTIEQIEELLSSYEGTLPWLNPPEEYPNENRT